ncbi:MAG: hypothetical protein Q9227_001761 [Pyrenula ochraceoflavens]
MPELPAKGRNVYLFMHYFSVYRPVDEVTADDFEGSLFETCGAYVSSSAANQACEKKVQQLCKYWHFQEELGGTYHDGLLEVNFGTDNVVVGSRYGNRVYYVESQKMRD